MKRLAILLFVFGVFHANGCSPSLVKAGNDSKVKNQNQAANENVVTHWNDIANEIFPIQPGPILDSRAFAIFHIAIHDAVNAIERRYKPYAADLSSPGASIDAAVASASREVLLELAPDHAEKINESYNAALADVADGQGKNDGINLGRKCAKAILEKRADDGIETVNEPAYVPTHEPGGYDFTPPFNKPPLGPAAFFPGFGRIQTFFVDPAKHRLPGPDSLQSDSYADDLIALKLIGKQDSTTRTADQTEIAFFWFEGGPILNQIATTVIRQQNLDPWKSARILALMNIATADALIICFEAKYHFRFWRPYTAIRRADEDGNSATEPDKTWRPLLWPESDAIPPKFFIPPIPEYPSAAATGSAAAAEVLIQNFNDDIEFDATSPYVPNVTRHFKNFSHMAREFRLSRVYGGIHFKKAINDGFHLGKKVGAEISTLLPAVRR